MEAAVCSGKDHQRLLHSSEHKYLAEFIHTGQLSELAGYIAHWQEQRALIRKWRVAVHFCKQHPNHKFHYSHQSLLFRHGAYDN